MPHCMVGTNGKPYFFSEFEGSENSMYMWDYSPVFPAGSSPDKRNWKCTYKGDFIDVYALMKEAYNKSDEEFDYVKTSSGYAFGKVIATHEYKDNGNDYIAALVVDCYLGDTLPSYVERQAELRAGSFVEARIYSVTVRYYYKDYRYDYNRFDFGTSSHTEGWYFRNTLSPATQSIQLAGLLNGEDGVTIPVLNLPSLLIPIILTVEGETRYIGITNTIYLNSDLTPYGSFSNINVSEDIDDFIGLNRNRSLNTETYFTTDPPHFCLYDFTSGYTPPEPPSDNPFEDDTNEGGGGNGDYKDTSDTIPVDGNPSVSAIASGFVNAYLLSQQEVYDFHDYMYSTDFLDNCAKLMNDPIDYILSFMLAPYTPDTSAQTTISIGGTHSTVTALRISSGYKTVDCGTISLHEFWGKFYDYAPYTQVQIYLPFIGVRSLDIDDVMAGDINLQYRIDVLTGECVATVSVNNTRGTNGAIYHFNGNCHSHIPVSGKNYGQTAMNVAGAAVGAIGSVIGGVASGGVVGGVLGGVAGAINVAKSTKTPIEHTGNLSGCAGLLANYTPFLIVSRPSQSLAANFNHYRGFISNVTRQLSSLSGYTEVAELVQTNIHCTLDEFEEINDLLKSGVYL